MTDECEDSKALIVLKRVGVSWPLVMLPFVPAIGKIIAGFIIMVSI
jgi:hypothetical protein